MPRSEDRVLLKGAGHYADNVNLPGQVYAVTVRSHVAHGLIRSIDTAAVRGMQGHPLPPHRPAKKSAAAGKAALALALALALARR